jgi:hypothetical protein
MVSTILLGLVVNDKPVLALTQKGFVHAGEIPWH